MNEKVRLLKQLIQSGLYPLDDPKRLEAVVSGLTRDLEGWNEPAEPRLHDKHSNDSTGRLHVVFDDDQAPPAAPHRAPQPQPAGISFAAYRARAKQVVPGVVMEEAPGILTSLTRRLPPDRAVELYRRITPIFVYQVMERLSQSANVRVIQILVDHLCSDEAQRRLRNSKHVRDAILDEIRGVLGRNEIHPDISRDELHNMLAGSGAMYDLIAMENCIQLAAKAS
jgi:hypothetical protein